MNENQEWIKRCHLPHPLRHPHRTQPLVPHLNPIPPQTPPPQTPLPHGPTPPLTPPNPTGPSPTHSSNGKPYSATSKPGNPPSPTSPKSAWNPTCQLPSAPQ